MSSGSHSTLDWPSSPSGRPASHFSHQITQICRNSMHLGLLEKKEEKKKQNTTTTKKTTTDQGSSLSLKYHVQRTFDQYYL